MSSRARRLTQEPPFHSLPDALITLVAEQGFQITRQDAEDFISKTRKEPPKPPKVPNGFDPPGPDKDVLELVPEQPGSLRHTSVEEGRVGDVRDNNWNGMLFAAIKIALERGSAPTEISRLLSLQI